MKLIFKYLITASLGFLVLVFSIATFRYFIDTPPMPDESNLIKAKGTLKEINCTEEHVNYIQISGIQEDIILKITPLNLNLCAETTQKLALGKQVSLEYFKNKGNKTHAYYFNYEGLEVFNFQDCQASRRKLIHQLMQITATVWGLLLFVIFKYWRNKHNQTLQRTR